MHSEQTADVLILGKGVIGLSAARELALRHPDLSIAILDAPTSAMVASRAAAGMLSPSAEFGDDSPLGRLGAESLALYPEFVRSIEAETGLDVGLSWAGTLIPLLKGHEEEFEAKLAECRTSGTDHRLLEGDGLRRAEPGLSGDIERAIWLHEGVLNSCILHDALIECVGKLGVAFIEGKLVDVEKTDQHVHAIRLADGRRLVFGTLIAATGAWTDDIAGMIGLSFGIRPIKGQIARVGCPDGLVRHTFHLKSFYMAPRAGEGVILGSTMEEAGFDTSVSEEVIARFVREANSLFPNLAEYTVAETWVGFRPRSADGMPIIGWISRSSNVFVATGHFRNGILLAPMTGHMVARLFDDPDSAEWAAFSPQRETLLSNTRA